MDMIARVSSRGPDPRMFGDPRSPTPLFPGPRRGWESLEFSLKFSEFQKISMKFITMSSKII